MGAVPVTGRIASPYGWRWLNGRSDFHSGVDIGAPEGTPVHAVLPGVVVLAAKSGELDGYGNVIVIRHAAALLSLYAHLAVLGVAAGQPVEEGQTIGTVGRTAGTRADPAKMFDSSGAHLHLEFLDKWPPAGRDLDRIDPGPVLQQLGVIIPNQGPPFSASGRASSSETPIDYERSSTVRASSSAIAGLFVAAALYYAVQKTRRPLRLFA